jgi:hypothetical protein
MKNQFFYVRKQVIPPVEGETEVKYETFLDSFNVNLVIRSMHLDDGRRLVLLSDIHERTTEVPDINLRTNKQQGTKKVRNTFQSEIYLEVDDAKRFLDIMNIE